MVGRVGEQVPVGGVDLAHLNRNPAEVLNPTRDALLNGYSAEARRFFLDGKPVERRVDRIGRVLA